MNEPTRTRAVTQPLDFHRRSLTESEKRSIRGKLGNLRTQGRRASRVSWWIGSGVFTVLWALTLLASDASWIVVTSFWAAVGTSITFWVRRDLSRELGHGSKMALQLKSALRRDEAEVYEFRSTAFVEFEEVEDEGACYAFDLGNGRLAFLSGQEFYPNAGFPSLDFALIYVIAEDHQAVDMLLDARGPRTDPLRTIQAGTKWEMDIPESLTTLQGSLEDLEEQLTRR